MVRRLRLLHLEDSEEDHLIIRRHLLRAGVELIIRRVESEVETRHALQTESWDAVLADYVLPGFSADDAIRLLREMELDLPLLIVSGMMGEDAAVAAMRAGAHDYLMKDRLARLLPAIERAVAEAAHLRDRRRQEQERRRMEEALRESEALLAAQKELLELIARGAPLPRVLEQAVRLVEQRSPGCWCAVLLPDASGRNLRYAAAPNLPLGFKAGAPAIPIGPHNGCCGMAAYRRESLFSSDIASDPLWSPYRTLAISHGIRSCRAEPILGSQGQLLGTLAVYFPTARRPDAGDQRVASLAANLAAIAVERSKAEEARNLKLQTLMEHMAEGVIAVDEAGRLLVANPAAFRLLGLTEAPEGVLLDEVGFPPELLQALRRAASPDCTGPFRFGMLHGPFSVEVYLSPVGTEFGRYGSLALLKDATAEVQFRRLQDSFVANVSHELRGPLASILAVAEALRDGLIGPEQQPQYVDAIRAEVQRLRDLTDELLDLSKLEAGIARLERAPFDLAALCSRLSALWGPRSAQSGLTLQVECPSIAVVGDEDRVEQVLVNLLENAVRFTPPGGRVRVMAQPEGDWVRITVADDGIGIPERDLPYIFERFYKVDRARTLKPGSGTGLGLSITRKLVEQMGGQIHVQSQLQRGTQFSLLLPLSHGEGCGITPETGSASKALRLRPARPCGRTGPLPGRTQPGGPGAADGGRPDTGSAGRWQSAAAPAGSALPGLRGHHR